jgi:hypothetical protein
VLNATITIIIRALKIQKARVEVGKEYIVECYDSNLAGKLTKAILRNFIFSDFLAT